MSYNLGAQHFFGDKNQGHEICYDRIYSGYTLKHCVNYLVCASLNDLQALSGRKTVMSLRVRMRRLQRAQLDRSRGFSGIVSISLPSSHHPFVLFLWRTLTNTIPVLCL